MVQAKQRIAWRCVHRASDAKASSVWRDHTARDVWNGARARSPVIICILSPYIGRLALSLPPSPTTLYVRHACIYTAMVRASERGEMARTSSAPNATAPAGRRCTAWCAHVCICVYMPSSCLYMAYVSSILAAASLSQRCTAATVGPPKLPPSFFPRGISHARTTVYALFYSNYSQLRFLHPAAQPCEVLVNRWDMLQFKPFLACYATINYTSSPELYSIRPVFVYTNLRLEKKLQLRVYVYRLRNYFCKYKF